MIAISLKLAPIEISITHKLDPAQFEALLEILSPPQAASLQISLGQPQDKKEK